jgi:hypothetical protein
MEKRRGAIKQLLCCKLIMVPTFLFLIRQVGLARMVDLFRNEQNIAMTTIQQLLSSSFQ